MGWAAVTPLFRLTDEELAPRRRLHTKEDREERCEHRGRCIPILAALFCLSLCARNPVSLTLATLIRAGAGGSWDSNRECGRRWGRPVESREDCTGERQTGTLAEREKNQSVSADTKIAKKCIGSGLRACEF